MEILIPSIKKKHFVILLLKDGVDPSSKQNNLSRAKSMGYMELVKILIDNEADLDNTNDDEML